jgi:hypothetical protein
VCALVAWLVYSLTDPALNLALASGRMQWPIRGHVVTVALAAALAAIAGPDVTPGWLYADVVVAMAIGSAITLAGVHASERMPWRVPTPRQTLLLAPELLPWPHPVLRWSAVAAAYFGFLALALQHPSARWLLAAWRPPARTSPTVT